MTAPRSESRIVVGLMSGTSLDGVSAAVVRFGRGEDGRIAYDLLGMSVRHYEPAQHDRLAKALREGTPREYCRLSFDLGDWLADAAIKAMAEAGVAPTSVAAIASHGQTVWHEPGHSTWQFGEPSVIAERTGVSVVSNFRVRDVAAAGQGAPLVPAADSLLFAHATELRGLQNLGGIGNVSVVPPGGLSISTRAFDTGPGVVVIDGATRALAPGNQRLMDPLALCTNAPDSA
jgi:anhydro-N-acetylmuramic acid kinase